MYTVGEFLDKYKVIELKDEVANSLVHICPERGGIVTGFQVAGTELFYLDKQTFYDLNANIRGGNPVLFPICGQLKDGQYEWDGAFYRMKNHGFARNMVWDVGARCSRYNSGRNTSQSRAA